MSEAPWSDVSTQSKQFSALYKQCLVYPIQKTCFIWESAWSTHIDTRYKANHKTDLTLVLLCPCAVQAICCVVQAIWCAGLLLPIATGFMVCCHESALTLDSSSTSGHSRRSSWTIQTLLESRISRQCSFNGSVWRVWADSATLFRAFRVWSHQISLAMWQRVTTPRSDCGFSTRCLCA